MELLVMVYQLRFPFFHVFFSSQIPFLSAANTAGDRQTDISFCHSNSRSLCLNRQRICSFECVVWNCVV